MQEINGSQMMVEEMNRITLNQNLYSQLNCQLFLPEINLQLGEEVNQILMRLVIHKDLLIMEEIIISNLIGLFIMWTLKMLWQENLKMLNLDY